ncbi:MAG: hypothetical protein BVN35_17575 [Proteobacteria bacterium ST_bin11]|nr:MAG: hypothetical protein BVN35_17575 [Proteobacteria bacterium ST_bin11]
MRDLNYAGEEDTTNYSDLSLFPGESVPTVNEDREEAERSRARKNRRLYNIHRQRLNKRKTREGASDEEYGDDCEEDDYGDDDEDSSDTDRLQKRQCTNSRQRTPHSEEAEEPRKTVARVYVQGYDDNRPHPLDSEWPLELESNVRSDSDYLPVMEERHRQILMLLREGESPNIEKCFACNNTHDIEKFYYKDWEAVVMLYEAKRHSCTNYFVLGQELYDMFTKRITNAVKASGLIDPDAEFWTPYGIIFHFLYHHGDVVRHMTDLFVRSYLLVDTMLKSDVIRAHPTSGRTTVPMSALRRLKVGTDIVTSLSKTLKVLNGGTVTQPFSASASIPDNETMQASMKIYAPSAKALIQRPNFAPSHRIMQFPPT